MRHDLVILAGGSKTESLMLAAGIGESSTSIMGGCLHIASF